MPFLKESESHRSDDRQNLARCLNGGSCEITSRSSDCHSQSRRNRRQAVSKRSKSRHRNSSSVRIPADAEPPRTQGWPVLLAVFCVALVVRSAVAADVWHLPIVRTPKLDSAEYVSWARRLASGDHAWPLVSQHGPGYPYFLAALLVIFSGSLHAALFAQCILGAATATVIAAIAQELLNARIALLQDWSMRCTDHRSTSIQVFCPRASYCF